MFLVMLSRRLRTLFVRGAALPAGEAADSVQPGLLAALKSGPELNRVDIPPAIQAVRIIVLVMVVVTVPLSTPNLGHGAQGIAVAVALAVSAVSWVIWQFFAGSLRMWVILLVIMGAAGGALAGLSSLSTAVAVGFVVTGSAGARLALQASLAVTAETIAAFFIAAIVSHAPIEAVIGWSAGFLGMWAFGLTRRAYIFRAVEAEEALEQARRAHTAETQAAALGERARIAREIHDVLAHALAAVSVNLQAAEGLLDAVPDKGPELAKAIECVQRAGALTKEGMTETRNAILALRDDAEAPAGYSAQPARHPDDAAGSADASSAVAPGERLTSRLQALADEHGAAGDAAVKLTVDGTPRPLTPEGAMAVYRTAQEALTNARKHAPGQPVTISVTYLPDDVTLLVSSALPDPEQAAPLSRAGTGYGLTGLRERAALTGGTLSAGPAGHQWQVRLRLPA
ncbi:MAG TPA: histidine kinase [Trebonia sp.]|nr:histidine kinase [Trebonia sp.]